MPRGGKRQGSGRPEGTVGIKHSKPVQSRAVVLTREVVQEEFRQRTEGEKKVSGLRALDVMRDNMDWYYNVAETLLDKCKRAHEEGDNAVALDFFGMSVKVRGELQKVAAEIAPYEDPKLSATVPAPPPPDPNAGEVINEQGDHLGHLTQRFTKGLSQLKVVNGGKA